MRKDREEAVLKARPYETVDLKFETNFFVPDAQEQRGERKLAVLVQFTAD